MNKIVSFALLSTLVSCGPAQQIAYPPEIKVQDIRLTGLTLPSFGRPAQANLDLNLQVTNPNPISVRLVQIRAQLVLDGQRVGEISVPDVNLPAQGSTSQRAQLTLPLNATTATAFVNIARGEEVSYRLDGTFTADLGPLGQPTFGPFTFAQGVWKQAALKLF